MPYLVAAVVLVGLLCLLDLLLTLGVVRRLREYSEILSRLSSQAPAQEATLPAGAMAGEFDATATNGEKVSPELLPEGSLVGFFSSHCPSCSDQLAAFVEYASALPGGRRQALAVVVGWGDAGETVTALASVARVVLERPFGPVASAFAVHTFPVFYLVGANGEIAAAGVELTALPAARAA